MLFLKSLELYAEGGKFNYVGYCILRSVTVGSAEQNGRDAERAVAYLTA